VLYLVFRIPSDPEHAWLFGFSLERILIGGGFFSALIPFGLITFFSYRQPIWWQKMIKGINDYISSKNNLFWFFTSLYLFLILLLIPLVVSYLTPAINNLAIFHTIMERFGAIIFWFLLMLISLGVILYLNFNEIIKEKRIFLSGRISLWVIPFLAIYIYSLRISNEYSFRNPSEHFEIPLVLLGLYFLIWGGLNEYLTKKRDLLEKVNYSFLVMGVFAVTFVFYQHYAYLLDWVKTPRKAYWHLLAQAFLNGKLYLSSPSVTNDLTFYLGHWYFPSPPLGAVMMIPYVFFVGVENVNVVLFSIFFSSINSMLLFLILEQLRTREWVKLSRGQLLWLVVLFAFGTPHWFSGIIGLVWYVSQIVAVTFLALSIFCGLKGWSPWLVGLSLGLAMASRPNLFVIWPFLLAIAIQIVQDSIHGKLEWKWLVMWISESAVPVIAVVVSLLLYNYLRFGNLLDFGYLNIDSSAQFIENARKFGLFSIHFIPANLSTMFLTLPSFRPYSPFLFPSLEGMNIFLTTPALVYLIHKYEKKWWSIGAWVSVVLSVILLSFYSNNGAAQFGYRYILDFIVPLMMLLAVALGKKSSWIFRVLVLISVLINGFGVWWFIHFA
jgi:hypothetical protein